MMLVVDEGNFFVVVRGNLGLTARQFLTSMVDFWIYRLDYRVHLWTALCLREVIFKRGWRVGYQRMGLFCLVTMPTLIRDTWQHPFRTFRQVARMTIIIFSHSCTSVSSAFGQLVSRWGILRSAMPLNITIVRTVAMVNCLARLHNFCIDEADRLGEVAR